MIKIDDKLYPYNKKDEGHRKIIETFEQDTTEGKVSPLGYYEFKYHLLDAKNVEDMFTVKEETIDNLETHNFFID